MDSKRRRQILWLLMAGYSAVSAAAQSSRLCAACHPKVWETYRQTGMGRSFHAVSKDDFKAGAFYHRPSETYFAMLQRDGKYFQRAYQLDSTGREINVTEKQIDYIMGSGNHARTYLNRTSANTLLELPLGWYAEKGGYWAMNPGYDRLDHDGFRRPITYDCMFCHNAYPKIPAGHEQPFAEPVYSGPLPEGIDCQRCHGAGTRHMQLAGAGAAPEQIRKAIVNPARLSAERQMEGCMVCHLETTSFPLPNAIQRFERSAFSYQPGEPLGDFILNFDHAPESGREDKFEIVNAAYRLRRSACFLKSNGKMLCTTCHNPHDIPRGEAAQRHYIAVCRQCHAQLAGTHTTEDDCAGCHMPKRRTEDVIHVAATDHYIQRQKPPGDLLAEKQERQDEYRGRVSLYYPHAIPETPENKLTVAVAQVIQGSNLQEGITELSAAIAKYQPRRAEYYFELGEALQSSGDLPAAVSAYREAVRRNPKFPLATQKLGTALRLSGQYREAAQALKQATLLDPNRAVTWHELGLTYRSIGNYRDAAAALQKAITLNPDLPEAHNNLGNIWLSESQQSRAESEFRTAISIRPAYADAHGNLASVLSAAGKVTQARDEFEMALRLRPTDAATSYNYAMMLGRTGQYDEAQKKLEDCLRADPSFTDAHLLLGDLLMARQQAKEAAPHYRAVLRSVPDSSRAHFGLGAALLASGEQEEGVAELKKAAAGSDAGIRQKADEVLRQATHARH